MSVRTFRSRHHRRLLDGPLVADPVLRAIQVRYQRKAGDETVRRRLAREFAEAVADLPAPSLLERVQAMSFPQFVSAFLPFELAAFQRRFDAEFSRLHDDGSRIYKVGTLLIPRGNGKTSLASARALYEALRRQERSDVLFAASSKSQAQIAYQYIRSWVRLNGELRAAVSLTKEELVVSGLMKKPVRGCSQSRPRRCRRRACWRPCSSTSSRSRPCTVTAA